MTKGKLLLPLLFSAVLMLPSVAAAQVVATFYSHDLGSTFPHAFFTLKGKLSDGREVDTNYGFTAKSVSPAILMGSVVGVIEVSKPNYVKSSDAQFSIKINDGQFEALVAHVEKWRTKPGKSYNLNTRNCIHFVGEAAQILGLKVDFRKDLLKKPKSFLIYLKSLNPWLGK
jgi:hypothetical protein